MRYKVAKKKKPSDKWLDITRKTIEKETDRQYTGRELTGDSKVPAVLYMAIADRQKKGYKGDLLGFKNKKELQDWASGILRSGAHAKADIRKQKSKEELDEALFIASMAHPATRAARTAYDVGSFAVDTASKAKKAYKDVMENLAKNRDSIGRIRQTAVGDGKTDSSMGDKAALGFSVAKGLVKDPGTEKSLVSGATLAAPSIAEGAYRTLSGLGKQAPLPPIAKAGITAVGQGAKAVRRSLKPEKQKLQQPESFDRKGIKDYLGGKKVNTLTPSITKEVMDDMTGDYQNNPERFKKTIRAVDSAAEYAKSREKKSSVYRKYYQLGCLAAQNSIRH